MDEERPYRAVAGAVRAPGAVPADGRLVVPSAPSTTAGPRSCPVRPWIARLTAPTS
ncbi:hypothetical protein [Streptomyces marianii]|uniref:hypothetical protein n=1 Tax=Streptomyces marianii TaxID=1817406 RepID=UPI0014865534|nr:hypothetical protein [Streptomyces marianii]